MTFCKVYKYMPIVGVILPIIGIVTSIIEVLF